MLSSLQTSAKKGSNRNCPYLPFSSLTSMCNSNLNSVISPPGVLGLPTHSGSLGGAGTDFLLQASTPLGLKQPKSHLVSIPNGDLSDIYSETKIQAHSEQLCRNFWSFQQWDCEMRSFLSLSYLCLERGPGSHLSNSTAAGAGIALTCAPNKASLVKLSSRPTEEW